MFKICAIVLVAGCNTLEAAPKEPEMVKVPAGTFLMGCSSQQQTCERWQPAQQKVELDAFEIDRYETTIGEYRACVRAGACSDKDVGSQTYSESLSEPDKLTLAPVGDRGCRYDEPGNDQLPMECVTWAEADAYCRWRKKRLPTSAEWEKAARGTDGRLHPWGSDAPTCKHAIAFEGEYKMKQAACGRMRAWPVGSAPLGASPYGAHDLAGNVAEWTADFFDGAYVPTAKNPKGPVSAKRRVVRGSAWTIVSLKQHYVTEIGNALPESRSTSVGFRCAR